MLSLQGRLFSQKISFTQIDTQAKGVFKSVSINQFSFRIRSLVVEKEVLYSPELHKKESFLPKKKVVKKEKF